MYIEGDDIPLNFTSNSYTSLNGKENYVAIKIIKLGRKSRTKFDSEINYFT